MVASLFVPASFGYGLLFALVALESAGLPLPGETSLLAAAVLAAQGHLSISLVILTAAAAAIVGDNIGYVIGRKGIRQLLARPGRFQRHRERLLEKGDEFFARNGSKAVFLGRWVTGVRVVIAWLAGADRMPWPRFALWNALGGISWACSLGLIAYAIGSTSSNLFGALGLVGLVFALVIVLVYLVPGRLARFRGRARRRRGPPHGAEPPSR